MTAKSITLRLTLLFAAASTLILMGLGLVIAASVNLHFAEMDAEELQGRLQLVRQVISTVQPGDASGAWSQRVADVFAGQDGLAIAISDGAGKSLFALGPAMPVAEWPGPVADSTDPYPVPSTLPLNDRTYRTIVALGQVPGRPQGRTRIMIGIDISQHVRFLAAFRTVLCVSIAVAMACAALLGWFAASRGLKPVRQMAGVARGISAQQLDGRIDPLSQPRELTGLVEAFNAMLTRLQDSFERLSDFSSDLAHELRTPISNLMTQTQVALSKPRDADAYRETLYSNLEEFNRLARMIADMLLLAKADHGLMIPNRAAVDLTHETRSLVDFYEALAEDRGIALQCSGSAGTSGDASMLRRAISNLVSNAIRHTPDGGTVEILLRQTTDAAEIEVRNTGSTIATEHRDRIFDRFYRVDTARPSNSEGIGLGLAIAKSIVEAHGGGIAVASQDSWTSFTIRLPDGGLCDPAGRAGLPAQ